ncbi:MAG: UDP-2,3-diacylglucosamine diphosphatase [Saprospiraceae bacterium]|nr:UDP-2,3-diacylglucosamine diphosphatase [Saprospiraceae bacterium]
MQEKLPITLPANKAAYFASDFHLGISGKQTSIDRERQIVRWLDQIKEDAGAIFLVGDLFDFWFEYHSVIPKGYTRFLGKLAELRDHHIPIYIFTGNHDMWIFSYFEEELGIPTYREPIRIRINDKQFMIGHGDGLGPGDYGYKFIKRVFAHPFAQWLFARLHPNFGIGLANFWSSKSRGTKPEPTAFQGPDREWLIHYANGILDEKYFDYFLFGHRHLPIDFTLKNNKSRYLNLGEWLTFTSYARFDGEQIELLFFDNEDGKVAG